MRTEFFAEFDRRFGTHIHILDWALHLDEATPHIHERHVFDCENKYGENAPQQEKALEVLGFDLPDPGKPKGKHNNRKQTFDAACRELLFSIAQSHGLQLEHEPEYGGRAYLKKQDFILMKQKEQLTRQEEKLEELTLKIEDVETLLDDVAEAAYDKAVEVVTDVVQAETRKADIAILDEYQERINRSKNSPQTLKIANQILNKAREKLAAAAAAVAKKVAAFLYRPEVRETGKEQIKQKARTSVLAKLKKAREWKDQESVDTDRNRSRKHEMEI